LNADGLGAKCGAVFGGVIGDIVLIFISSGGNAPGCFSSSPMLIFARYAESEQDGPPARLALSTQFPRPS
jgi:hypothetical protein